MKIITNDAVYVQKNDIVYLSSSDLPIPASMFMKVFGNDAIIINDSNRYDFVKFEDVSDIEYFKGLDWMIDYNQVKDLTEEKIIGLVQNIAREQEENAITFNSMPEEERKNHMHLIKRSELLEYWLYSLRDLLWFKQRHIPMKLPKGVDYPIDYIKENGIKKLLKRKFKKQNK